jgi:hypothetical protein
LRKSERIRQLELSVVKLQLEVEILNSLISLLLGNENQNMDAGKWYNRRPDLGS